MDQRSSVFEISAAGMRLEKMRIDVAALNIANMNTSRTQAGGIYKPLKVVAQASGGMSGMGFSAAMEEAASMMDLPAPPQAEVVATNATPRTIHDPGHPHADAKVNVSYPGVDHLTEMINLVSALRAYEANVVALNAGKVMASKALEIGGAA